MEGPETQATGRPDASAPATGMGKAATTALCLFVPMLAALLAHWYGLFAYFQQDDFVWLGLGQHGLTVQDIFLPSPHGTWRPVSERLFFVLARHAFGIDAAPFHGVVFAAQFLNIALLYAVVARLSRSRVAGLLASAGWAVSPMLVLPLTWTAACYQVFGAGCFLAAFYCFIRQTDGGGRSWLVAGWAIYLVGYGVIETMFVYPLVALAYAVCHQRRALRQALWLMLPAAVYVVLRLWLVPIADAGPYQLRAGTASVATALEYWQWVAGAGHRLPVALALLIGFGVVGVLLTSLVRGRTLPLVYVALFVFPLAPMLLVAHVTTYYATIPLIGVAAFAGDAAARWMQQPGRGALVRRAGVGLVVAAYLALSVRTARAESHWWYDRSQLGGRLMTTVRSTHAAHPGSGIFIENIDRDLFWSHVLYTPWELVGIYDVFAPADVGRWSPDAPVPQVKTLSDGQVSLAATAGTLRILHVGPDAVTDVTDERVATLTRAQQP